MDLQKTIRQLKIEKERIDRAIAAMEELLNAGGGDPNEVPKRRGRNSMPPEERRKVSERMTRYWKNKRQGQTD